MKGVLRHVDHESGSVLDFTRSEHEVNPYRVGKKRIRKEREVDPMDEDRPRPMKKQRTKKTSDSRGKSKGKKRGRPAILLSMPWDILFEIFRHLRPIDLLQLTHAYKPLNKILMSKSGESLWKAARKNIPAFPETPSDKSDAEWVHLIFETNCHGPRCKEKGIRNIDWALRIRACDRCLEKNLVGRSWPFSSHPDPAIVGLLPYSITHGPADRPSQCYWKPAVVALLKTLDEYNKNQLRKPGVMAALHAFKKTQAVHAAKAVEYAPVCEAWESAALEKRQKKLQNMRDERFKEISAQFVNLGWIPEHIESLKGHELVRKTEELTEEAWVDIHPKLENALQASRYERRRQDIDSLLEDYLLRTYSESLQAVFRHIFKIIENDDLEDRVKADGTHDFTPLELEQCRVLLPTLLEACLERTRIRFLAKLPSSVKEPKGTLGSSRIELATSALTCLNSSNSSSSPSGSTLGHIIYWPEIVTHKCFRGFSRLVYDPKLSAIIRAVVRAVGLSPNLATPSQLDAHDARLKCASTMSCVTIRGMSWRDAVAHFSTSHAGKASPCWLLEKQVR